MKKPLLFLTVLFLLPWNLLFSQSLNEVEGIFFEKD